MSHPEMRGRKCSKDVRHLRRNNRKHGYEVTNRAQDGRYVGIQRDSQEWLRESQGALEKRSAATNEATALIKNSFSAAIKGTQQHNTQLNSALKNRRT